MPYLALLVVVLCSAAISIATRSDGAALIVVLLLTGAHLATIACTLKRWSRWQLALAMGLLAALALPATPFHEDDYFRYWWDGLQTLAVGNPYGSAPADFYGDTQLSAAQHTALDGVNYPDTPTIYAPGLQALFATAVAIGGPSLWPMRLMLALLHILAMQWAWRHLPPRTRVLLALNPLIWFFGLVNLHPDILIGWLIFAAVIVVRQARPWRAGLLIGAALACKISALVVIPALISAGAHRDRRTGHASWLQRAWRFWTPRCRYGLAILIAAAAVLLIAYAPFPGSSASDIAGLQAFGKQWTFNPLLFALLETLLGDSLARLSAAGLLLALGAVLLRGSRRHVALGATLLLLALLSLSPVVNAWYLMWLLPVAALTRLHTVWLAAIALSCSVLTLGALDQAGDPFALHPWAAVVQWIVLGLAVMVDGCRLRAVRWNARGF